MLSMYCKNHPDRPKVVGRLCQECLKESQRAHNRRYFIEKFSCNIDIPSKEELSHLVEKNYPIKSISQRYQVTASTVQLWLKKYGLETLRVRRCKLTDKDIKLMRDERMNASIRVMDFEYSAVPKFTYNL